LVVDTSAILAVLFNEPHARWVADALNANRGRLIMSTVNLAEALIRIRGTQSTDAADLEARLLDGKIQFVAPDQVQATEAARARLRLPLNLGDCFVYALAVVRDEPILTIDADFRNLDRPVLLPP